MRIPLRVPCLALLTSIVGCGGDVAAPDEPVPFDLTLDRGDQLAAALEDLNVRVLPHLDAPGVGAGLKTALDEVAVALEARSASDLTRSLRSSNHFLKGLEARPDLDAAAADLDAVRLVLAEAGKLLESPL